MSTPHATALQDAEPEAIREQKPDPTADEVAILSAARRFAKLDDQLMHYPGARSGHAYEILLAEWRTSRTALVNAARATPGDAP